MEVIEPKSTLGVFDVPGGYLDVQKDKDGDEIVRLYNRISLKELSGNEEELLATEDIPIIDRLLRILGNCITQVEDTDGNVIIEPQILVKAPMKMLLSDNTILLMKLRQVSIGNRLPFTPRCPECKTVLKKFVRLNNLEIVPLKGDPRERIRTYTTSRGNVLTWKMVDGAKQVSFEAEYTQNKKKKNQDKITRAMMMRVQTFNGEPATIQVLKDLPWAERTEIRNQFDEEGGLDTDVNVSCSACGVEFESEVEIGGKDFFYPTAISEN